MSDEEVCGVEDDAGKTKSANEEEEEEDVLMERKVDADCAMLMPKMTLSKDGRERQRRRANSKISNGNSRVRISSWNPSVWIT